MKNLIPGQYSQEELLQAIDELEEELMKIPTCYPDPQEFKSPFDEETEHN